MAWQPLEWQTVVCCTTATIAGKHAVEQCSRDELVIDFQNRVIHQQAVEDSAAACCFGGRHLSEARHQSQIEHLPVSFIVEQTATGMPKRPKPQAAVQPEQAPQSSSEDEEAQQQPLQGEDLDLSSDEELADEAASGSEGEEEQSDEGESEADEEIREALAEYLEAANAHRPADAAGDGEPAGTSGRDHA